MNELSIIRISCEESFSYQQLFCKFPRNINNMVIFKVLIVKSKMMPS